MIAPSPSAVSAPYWDAARRRELTLQRCPTCGRRCFHARVTCPHCGGTDLVWDRASGRGEVHTFTIARRPTHPSFAASVPYVIAIVELEEGPRMTSNIVGCAPDEVNIGMAVEVDFIDLEGTNITLPVFRPCAALPTNEEETSNGSVV